MNQIKKTSDIISVGQYQFGEKIITVDVEDDRYVVAIDNMWQYQGWKLRTWKTIQGVRQFISREIVSGSLKQYFSKAKFDHRG